MPTAAAVVLAGGSGSRLGAEGNKVYLPLAGRPLLSWSLEAFARAPGIGRLVLVTRPADRGHAEQAGGATRSAGRWRSSTAAPPGTTPSGRRCALLAPAIEAGELDVVAIHDGARPVVSQRLIADALAAAREHGAAVPGVPLTGVADHDLTPVAGTLVRVQTPQAFRADLLLAAYAKADADCFTGTDTAACVERYAGIPVHCIPGDPRNVKVTYRPDLALAERLLGPSGEHRRGQLQVEPVADREGVRRPGHRDRPGTRRDRPVRTQRRRAHRPRILQLHQLVARHRADDPAAGVDLLDRLGHLDHRHRRVRPGPDRGHHRRPPGTPAPAARCGSCSTTTSVPSGTGHRETPGGSTETDTTTPLPRNAETAWSINVVPSSRAELDLVTGDENDAGDGHEPLRRREPRRAAPRPCPRWSPRRARAR